MIINDLNDPGLIDLLKKGAVGVLPTDTLYGLVCCVCNQKAISRLYELKRREDKPGTIIAASVDQLVEMGLRLSDIQPIEKYWPNPISIVIPAGLKFKELHRGKNSLAVRVPKDDGVIQLLEQTGPLLTTSVNYPGESPANTVHEARQYFGDVVDFYVDGGDMSKHEQSTVVRIVDGTVQLLRSGAVKLDKEGKIINET